MERQKKRRTHRPPLRRSRAHVRSESPTQHSKDTEEHNHIERLLEALATFTNQDHGAVTMEEMSLIDQVYTAVLEDASGGSRHLQVIAEVLHRKWLSKPDFSPIAIKVVKRLADLHSEGHSDHLDEKMWTSAQNFRNIVYALVWKDYQDRHILRKTSKQIYANAAQFAVEFFNVFYKECYATSLMLQPLIKPIYHHLAILVDSKASEIEVDKLHTILSRHGSILSRVRGDLLFDVLLDVRLKLVESIGLADRARAQLMHILELSEHGWDTEALPARVRILYHARLNREFHQPTARRALLPVGPDGKGHGYAEHAKNSRWND